MWKQALAIPLHKNGDLEDKSNYLSISLLPIFSKVLEKIVATQHVDYLEVNKILSINQHGFRPKLSTTTPVTVLTNEIYDNVDNKRICLQTLCHISKTFDSSVTTSSWKSYETPLWINSDLIITKEKSLSQSA